MPKAGTLEEATPTGFTNIQPVQSDIPVNYKPSVTYMVGGKRVDPYGRPTAEEGYAQDASRIGTVTQKKSKSQGTSKKAED